MTFLDDNFITMSVEEENKLYIEKFKPTTGEWTADQWKETRLKLVEIFTIYKTDKILSLCEDLYFSIAPELQVWLAENVSVKIGGYIKKIAIIISNDMIVQMGVEQLMEEKVTGQITTRYFANESDARNWLFA